jgi:hypothetical protein
MLAMSKWICAIAVFVALLEAGCSRPVASGFLAPYEGFHRSSLLNTDLEYANPQAAWREYDKIRIFQVVLIYAPGSRGIGPKDVDDLTSFFEGKLIEAFGKDYAIVHDAGPDVLDLRVALTNLRPTNVLENAAAQSAGFLLPVAYNLGLEGYKHLTGDQLGMGEAQVEAEFRDSQTQARLYGYVARKIGSSLDIAGQTTTWGVVETAMSMWARVLVRQLKYRQDPSEFNKLMSEMK